MLAHLHRLAACPRRISAFTLLELLVVLVMVSLLLTVALLPALARSSDQSTRSICVNNLRQLGRASQMYASDNKDYLAYPNWGNTFQGWLFRPSGGSPPNLDMEPYRSDPLQAYRTGLWFAYVQDRNAYICPVDQESRYYKNRANKLSAYVVNGAVCGFDNQNRNRSCKISDVWNPECYLLWQPDEGLGVPPIGAFAYNDGSTYPDKNEGRGRLHSANGVDLVTVSGGVKFVSTRKSEIERVATGRSLIWWSPFSSNGH